MGVSLSEQVISLFPKFNIYVCEAFKQARFGRAMAGIFVFVRIGYDKFITRLNAECKFAIFLNCSKRIFKTDKDVLLSFVYLPPQGSPFYNATELEGIMLFEDVFLLALYFYCFQRI